ncbi:MAG: toxin HicA [Chloroflexi bacterium]|nr:toxin HicA [Chloroflexota bacterium]
MTKREKRLEKLRQNPKNVRPDELDVVLTGEGFVVVRQKGCHKHYDHGIHQLTVPQREHFLLDVYVIQALDMLDAIAAREHHEEGEIRGE